MKIMKMGSEGRRKDERVITELFMSSIPTIDNWLFATSTNLRLSNDKKGYTIILHKKVNVRKDEDELWSIIRLNKNVVWS